MNCPHHSLHTFVQTLRHYPVTNLHTKQKFHASPRLPTITPYAHHRIIAARRHYSLLSRGRVRPQRVQVSQQDIPSSANQRTSQLQTNLYEQHADTKSIQPNKTEENVLMTDKKEQIIDEDSNLIDTDIKKENYQIEPQPNNISTSLLFTKKIRKRKDPLFPTFLHHSLKTHIQIHVPARKFRLSHRIISREILKKKSIRKVMKEIIHRYPELPQEDLKEQLKNICEQLGLEKLIDNQQ